MPFAPPVQPVSKKYLRILYVMLALQMALIAVRWMQVARVDEQLQQQRSTIAAESGLAMVAPDQAELHSFERLRSAHEHLLSLWMASNEAARSSFFVAQCGLVVTFLFILGSLFAVYQLKRDGDRQDRETQRLQYEILNERSELEARITARTAELKAEVAERLSAEQLNHGRSKLLEMLMKEEDPHKIFDAMVELMTAGRSRWCCVLHLVRDGELVLQASSGLTGKFKRNLTQFSFDMTDGPEARALRLGGPQVIEDVSQDRRPWPQFLFAYGVQSLWCNPIFAMDGTPLGTLTVYSLLRCTPSKSDWAILDSNAQMAAMVLERHQMQQDLRRHAYHDSLTGLPNRLLGVERLSAAIERSAKTQNPVAVLWLDLDRFKQTNDLHGHGAGDVVLRETARRLQKRFRQSDTVARMGGDEFMAVLEGVPDRQTAESIATALFEELAAPIPFQGLNLMTSASIGVSLYPVDGETAELLERNADLAMYQAKFGRQGVRTYAPALDQALTERREIEKAMVVALEHGGFVLHYQPQYDSHGALSGFEALLRFPHPVLGMISPARLIPIAEESKMIVALGAWVLYEACSQSMRWQAEGLPPMQVAVNISAAQFEQQDFAEQVAAVLGETGLAPHLLELELTESVMVKDFVETTRQLECLKRLGVGIAVDDFGTGYSSLNHLHRLPIDRLKIDRSFIQALGEAKGSLAIIESIILMAHRMGMGVVAEGVETAEEMRTLCLQGCDSLQGYLLARPVEAAAAAKLLAEGSNVHLRRMNSQAASLTMVHRPMLVSA